MFPSHRAVSSLTLAASLSLLPLTALQAQETAQPPLHQLIEEAKMKYSSTSGTMPGMMESTMMMDKMMPAMSMNDKMMMDKMATGMAMPDKMMMTRMMMMSKTDRRVALKTAPPAANAGLQEAIGFADVDVENGLVEIVVTLPEGKSLDNGTVLEGWLSTAGRKGGPGPSTASDADEKFGPAFGMENLAMQSADIPYALSTGLLRRAGTSRTYFGRFHIDNPLTPYAAVAVTLESDGNTGSYDPRPGTPLMDGMIAQGAMMMKDGKMMSDKMMDK